MATHSGILAWKLPWTEEPGRLQPMDIEEQDMTERLPFYFSLSCIGEGNGSPLQCSCLENPRVRGTWWAAIYGVAQSRTRLTRLSSCSRCNFNPNIHPEDEYFLTFSSFQNDCLTTGMKYSTCLLALLTSNLFLFLIFICLFGHGLSQLQYM